MLGNTEEASYSEKTLRQQMLFRLWDVLNAQMPSRHETQMEASAKLIADANKAHQSASPAAGAVNHH